LYLLALLVVRKKLLQLLKKQKKQEEIEEATTPEETFEGVTLKMLTEGGHNSVAGQIATEIAAELGITLEQIIQPQEDLYTLIMKDWQTGGGAYDIVTLFPRFNAEFMGLGYLIPLDDYLDKFNAWDTYNNIIPNYAKIYTQWDGIVYGFVQDGDVAQMYYRKDIFENPELQSEFKDKYGYDLAPPDTYEQMFDIAEFVNGRDVDNDGEPEYALQFPSWKKQDLETDYLPFWGSYGGQYFDEEMNPGINSEAAVNGLIALKKALSYCPPGSITMGWSETMTTFVEGEVIMTLWYPDIGRLMLNPDTWGGKGGEHWRGKIGYALYPGVEQEDGSILRYASMSHGRINAITKFCENPEAAFAVLERLARTENAMKHVANAESGSDIFLQSMLDIELWGDFPIEEEYIEMHIKSMDIGWPELQLPGIYEYYDALRTGVQSYLTDVEPDPQKALDEVAVKWDNITDKWGREKQKELWLKVMAR